MGAMDMIMQLIILRATQVYSDLKVIFAVSDPEERIVISQPMKSGL